MRFASIFLIFGLLSGALAAQEPRPVQPMDIVEENFWRSWNDFRASLAFREMAWQLRAEFLAERYFDPRIQDWESREALEKLTEEFIQKLESLFEKLPEERQEKVAEILLEEFERAWESIRLDERYEYDLSRELKRGEASTMALTLMGGVYGSGALILGVYFGAKGAWVLGEKLLDVIRKRLSIRVLPGFRPRRQEPDSSKASSQEPSKKADAQSCREDLESITETKKPSRLSRWTGWSKEAKYRKTKWAVMGLLFAGGNYLLYEWMASRFYSDGHWFGFLGDNRPLEEKASWYWQEYQLRNEIIPFLKNSRPQTD